MHRRGTCCMMCCTKEFERGSVSKNQWHVRVHALRIRYKRATGAGLNRLRF